MAYLKHTARVRRSNAPTGLGELGLQIGPKLRIGGSVGKVLGNVQKAEVKAIKDTGHAVGAVASNPVVQGITAGALALTGVGAPAAAAILAAERGGGALLKKGGNIGKGARGAAEGAAAGVLVAKAPTILRGAGAVLKAGGSAIAHGVESMLPHGSASDGATDTNGSGTKNRRKITNGDADAVVDAKHKGRKQSNGSSGQSALEKLLAQFTGGATASTFPQSGGGGGAPTYSGPVQDGPFPDGTVPQQAGLLASLGEINPLYLAAGGGLLFVLLTRSHHSGAGRRSRQA